MRLIYTSDMNITIETYSLMMSMGLVGLLVCTIVLVFGYMFSVRIRSKLDQIEYFRYLEVVGILTLGGVIGALGYEYIYYTPVCEMCWYARVCIIPIAIIALAAAWWQIYKAELLIILFAALGLLVSVYHYYLHFRALVLEQTVVAPCGGGGLPSCVDSPILVWDFVTIPLMSIVLLLAVIFLAYCAGQSRKKQA